MTEDRNRVRRAREQARRLGYVLVKDGDGFMIGEAASLTSGELRFVAGYDSEVEPHRLFTLALADVEAWLAARTS